MKKNQKQTEVLIIDDVIYNEAIIKEMIKVKETNEAMILDLTMKLEASSKDGRKSQVLSLLREFKSISILEIASKLNISTKNVSSQLTYLRSDGHQIFTDPNGRKCLFEKTLDEDLEDLESDSLTDDSLDNEVEPLLEDTL